MQLNLIPSDQNVISDHYLHYKSLNKRLLKYADTCDYGMSYKTNIWGKHTGWHVYSPEIAVVHRWIKTCILTCMKLHKEYWKDLGWKFLETWFSRYDEGDNARPHRHFPNMFGWVYFVKTPKGSSPFVFTYSNTQIEAEEGKIIIFPASMMHNVPRNNCKDRVVLAGNIGSLLPNPNRKSLSKKLGYSK